ncbi:MAG: ankyrin repeat domain-containing protein [Alphaproteobacteria bacterium]|nr:ankyrin repeat domain-containing protein [Alphaproteobacteria bacterium]
MRKAPVFFVLMIIGATFGSPVAWAEDQCLTLSKAVATGKTSRAAELTASGVSVNCSFTNSYMKDSGETVTYSSTPLNAAAWEGNLSAVRWLLSHGANVNVKDGDGHTPLYNADDGLMYLEFMWGSDEEFEQAEAVYDLLKQAGGVMGR